MVAGKEDMKVAAVVCLGYPLKVALSLSPFVLQIYISSAYKFYAKRSLCMKTRLYLSCSDFRCVSQLPA